MRKLAIRAAFASLGALAIAGCTTSGIGTGQSAVGNVGATFTYTQTGATRGTMVASLTNGQIYPYDHAPKSEGAGGFASASAARS